MLPDFRVRQRDYLLEISRALTQELDLEKLLARILKIAIEMLAGQAGLITLKEQEGWRVAAAHGIAPAFLSYLTPLLAEENVRELNVSELNRMLKELTYTASMGLLNGTALPLVAHGHVIGVIFIFRNRSQIAAVVRATRGKQPAGEEQQEESPRRRALVAGKSRKQHPGSPMRADKQHGGTIGRRLRR